MGHWTHDLRSLGAAHILRSCVIMQTTELSPLSASADREMASLRWPARLLQIANVASDQVFPRAGATREKEREDEAPVFFIITRKKLHTAQHSRTLGTL